MSVQVQEVNTGTKNKALEQLVDKELARLFPARSVRRILLVAPTDVDVSLFDYETAKRGRYWNFPPYGLGIIATYMRNNGFQVKIINLNHEVLKTCRLSNSKDDFDFDFIWKTKLVNEIAKFHPDLIGVTCMFSQTHKSAVNVCNEIKRINPTLPLAIGGVHITNCFLDDQATNFLKNDFKNADFLFLYEAELAFQQFLKVVNQEVPLMQLCQIFFNSSPEKLYFTEKKIPTEKELDVIPAYDLMTPTELVNYGVIGSFFCFKEEGVKIATVLANRGCRGQCTYCSVRNFNGRGVRHRSVQSIIDELTLLRDKYNIAHIMWLDDDLFHNHQRALSLFKEMAKRKIGITWDCTNGVIALSCREELIAAALESGCIGLTIGVESGNSEMLKKIKKPGSREIFIKAARVLKKYEQINTRVFLMIGFPDETYRMILDTFDLAIKMDLDWYNVTIFEPLPNTAMFKSIIENKPTRKFEFEDIRYNVGPYGKIQDTQDKIPFSLDSREPFQNADLDTAPPKIKLHDIWFYMNYHLNFRRLSRENRLGKLMQHLKYLQNITNLIALHDPFPMYFCGYLQSRLLGSIDGLLIRRLEECLNLSEFWRRQFANFGLSVEHLKNGSFSELQNLT